MPIKSLIPRRQRRTYGDINPNRQPERPVSRPRPPKRKPMRKIAFYLLILGAVGIIIGTILVAWASRDLPDPEKLSTRQVAQSTKIYDRTGTHLLYEVYQNQKRTVVELDQIAPLAIKATIAIEDKHFYEHSGIRLISIFRAGFNNLIGRQTGSGGASTLTQQLVKNAVVGDEHSYFRKIKEAIMSMRLERKYSKDQILKMYLNEIPYGSTNYGIEAASQSYFKKSAKDLTLAEAATIAALPQQPSRFLNNLDLLKTRRDITLNLMLEQNYITEEEKNEAEKTPLVIEARAGIMDAPHFVLYVKQLLADRYGEKTIDQSGWKVITTLDYDKQKIAETAVKELGDKFAKEANANNAALVAIDPKTGQILSMIGSRDYFNDEIAGQYNVAVLGKRQPGSSFKPFVYTAAFEQGYTPETVLYDVETNFEMRSDGTAYAPKNYDGKEYGLVTMRQALQGSLNIPAVKTLYLVGDEKMKEYAKKFGYTTLTGDYGLSLVLGGGEVNLLEHTNAYATLANEGKYIPNSTILKIIDNQGTTIFEWQEIQPQEAIKPELAALTSSVLSDNKARAFIFGINNTLTLPDRPIAAKTGTTNDYKDAWTMGYVPSLAAGVWVGNTTPSPMKGGGNMLAGQIWNRFMKESLANTPIETFPIPPPNIATKPVLRGAVGSIKLKLNNLNGKIATTSTPENLIVEKEYLPPHTILHYVIKDNPMGPTPTNPADDQQYTNWENALNEWVGRQQQIGKGITFSEPPTELDDFQTSPELAPVVEFLYPTGDKILNDRQIEIRVEATSPRGVSEIHYKLDGNPIGSSHEFPFTISYYAKYLPKGTHTLTAVAIDDIGNSTAKEIAFDLQAEFDSPEFNWFDQSPLAIKSEEFPRAMSVTPFRWNEIKDIKIYLISSNENKKLIYTFDHNDQLVMDKITFVWKNAPIKDSWTLSGVMTDENGKQITKNLEIIIE
ncbi:MAG: penicillin-binding protein [Candidatus Magasanikbacteria bacterium CG10_big_fil_rev_8_21_14_0_10_36_32]|uniref:Penicillin-binding protein n=1 Tax=Candidatus Magasanikbacteria bacterium CG10_big_fil_rev_8_21_14_0_10_36_32 TaxID=1974646 RepID=A0A2M6W6X1_9BACT|nr:MAG: penicillin-binding protein [Candidatus Magasanikbacteria bacterium CG10_big_fil_rev_8_21_14_0_10_36_32]